MSSSSVGPLRFSYEETVVHVRRMLSGFAPGYGDAQLSDRAYRIPVPSSKLAVPVLAREVMVVFGAEYRGRWDKVAWRYGFSVNGVPCMLESARSGLWLHIDAAVGDDGAEQLGQHVIEKLAAVQKVVNLTCDTIGGVDGGRRADLPGLVAGWSDLRTKRGLQSVRVQYVRTVETASGATAVHVRGISSASALPMTMPGWSC